MSQIAHPGPPELRHPATNGHELHVNPHRRPDGVTSDERSLVCVFLKRYVVWCAKARRIDRLRNAVDLLAEVAVR